MHQYNNAHTFPSSNDARDVKSVSDAISSCAYCLSSGLGGRRQPTMMTPVTDSKALNMLGRQ